MQIIELKLWLKLIVLTYTDFSLLFTAYGMLVFTVIIVEKSLLVPLIALLICVYVV